MTTDTPKTTRHGPKPGPTEKVVLPNGSNGNGSRSIPDTGRHELLSMTRGSPEREAMLKLIETLERRYSAPPSSGGGGGGGDGGGGGRTSDPVPKHLRRTKELIDFLKYVGMLIAGLVTIGWLGHEYISGFQTSQEADLSQVKIESSIDDVADAVRDNDDAIESLGISGVQIMLEQRNANDRLDQILELQTAGTSRTARRVAQEEVQVIQRRIDRRRRVMRDEHAIRRIAAEVQGDPLGGLEGL